MGKEPGHILGCLGDWAVWVVLAALAGMVVIGLVGFLGGCEALTPDMPSGTEGGGDPKASNTSGDGTFSNTATALWWMGLSATAAGLICLIAKLAGAAIMPSGTGVTAIVAGVPTMLAADVLAAHQWIAWVLLGLILVVGVVEMVGRKAIKRKAKELWHTLEREDA